MTTPTSSEAGQVVCPCCNTTLHRCQYSRPGDYQHPESECAISGLVLFEPDWRHLTLAVSTAIEARCRAAAELTIDVAFDTHLPLIVSPSDWRAAIVDEAMRLFASLARAKEGR